MKRRDILEGLVALGFAAGPLAAAAQQPGKVARVGYLSATSPSILGGRTDAFRQGLRELGYVEGKNLIIEWRFAEGKADSLRSLAAELVGLKVDVIVTAGSSATRSAKESTATIPIVMTQDSDPVGSRFVASLARPGANITGFSTLARELNGKRLELLKEIVPRLARVAVLGTSSQPANAQQLKETELAAGALGVKLQYLDVLGPRDLETVFRAVGKARADALLVIASPVINSHRTQVIDLAVKSRLPAIYSTPEDVDAGGLMTYGVSLNDLARRAATYVDKILKGRKPSELPVEQPIKFELIINRKAAEQIGLVISKDMLLRADKVIE